MSYADDVAIIARDQKSLRETLQTITTEARKREIEINEGKTKYMEVQGDRGNKENQSMDIEEYKFEIVKNLAKTLTIEMTRKTKLHNAYRQGIEHTINTNP